MSTSETMKAAADLLADLGASYMHPGFIYIRGMCFGDADGDAYRFNLEGGEPLPDNAVPADKWELPLTATAEELAEWVRYVVEKTAITDDTLLTVDENEPITWGEYKRINAESDLELAEEDLRDTGEFVTGGGAEPAQYVRLVRKEAR